MLYRKNFDIIATLSLYDNDMAVETFQRYLDQEGMDDIEILLSEEITNTAESAAKAHQVSVSNIIKSLLITDGNDTFLILVPGDRRMDLDLLEEKLNRKDLRLTTPDEAKQTSGYSIGGIPPFGHQNRSKTYIYKGFNKDDLLVGAAGSSNSVFKISYQRLIDITSATEI